MTDHGWHNSLDNMTDRGWHNSLDRRFAYWWRQMVKKRPWPWGMFTYAVWREFLARSVAETVDHAFAEAQLTTGRRGTRRRAWWQ